MPLLKGVDQPSQQAQCVGTGRLVCYNTRNGPDGAGRKKDQGGPSPHHTRILSQTSAPNVPFPAWPASYHRCSSRGRRPVQACKSRASAPTTITGRWRRAARLAHLTIALLPAGAGGAH